MDKIQINIEDNVNELLSKFKSNKYKQYKEHLNLASNVETIDNNTIKLYLPSNKGYTYKPPQYSNVYTMLDSLYSKYNDYVTDSLCSSKTFDNEIAVLIEHIITLQYYLLKVNYKFNAKLEKYSNLIKEFSEQLQTSKLNTDDQKKYFEVWDKMVEVNSKIENMKTKKSIDFIIDTLPELIEETSTTAKKEKPRKKSETLKENTAITLSSKFPFNKLPVKLNSIEECNSRSRSKRYYISLKDLILSIEKDDELKKIFGPRFKQMSKKDICNVIFKQKN